MRGLNNGAELFSVVRSVVRPVFRCDANDDDDAKEFLSGCDVVVLMRGLASDFFPWLLS